ncbi:MAG TPA: lipoprotein insertase outer membrane protein LolB [Steroidobacteraceae bacterium]|nr:lipoprotein insertase outer membrane protein LolB [Steroidobacteraceae bacterium]
MRRLSERLRRRWYVCGGVWLLAGCVTPPPVREPLAAPAQEQLLQHLAGFHLQGRAFAAAGQQSFNVPSLSWTQRDDESELRLSAPLGAGGLTVLSGANVLRVNTSRGEEFRDADAERMLSSDLGFVPPFAALRYWVLGLAAPGEPPQEMAVGEAGRIAAMTQQGWHLDYDRWVVVATSAGTVRLPQRLTATRADLRLKLFVDGWQLQPGD